MCQESPSVSLGEMRLCVFVCSLLTDSLLTTVLPHRFPRVFVLVSARTLTIMVKVDEALS